MSDEDRVINTWDQIRRAGGTGVVIQRYHGGIRTTRVDGFEVVRLVDRNEVPTDREAPWYHHKRKHFSYFGLRSLPAHERQRKAAEQAQAWVKTQGWYDGAWARNAQGDYVPADVQKRFPIRRRKKTEK